MKIKALKLIIKCFFCWVLLLQGINISIDPPDLKHFKNGSIGHKEGLSTNEIESIYKLISKVAFENTSYQTFNLYELLVPDFSIKPSSYYQNKVSVLHAELVFLPPKQV